MQNALRVKGNGDTIVTTFSTVVRSSDKNTKLPELVTGLVLMSGRRIAELLTGDVRLQQGSTDMSVIFQETKATKPVEIPLLCDTATFRYGIEVLGKLQGEERLSRRQVKTKYQTYVQRTFKFAS